MRWTVVFMTTALANPFEATISLSCVFDSNIQNMDLTTKLLEKDIKGEFGLSWTE